MPTVLITGANRGIGLEFVRQYAKDGWRVIAVCRKPDEADELNAIEGDVRIQWADVADRDSLKNLAEKVGPLDVLIANAGVYGPDRAGQSFGTLDYDGWARTMEVNLFGTVATLEALSPKLAANGKAVAISSQMGSIDDASSGSFAYRTSKTALNMAMTLIAAELGPKGISVATLHPGWVQTDMGGSNATVTPRDSVIGLREVIAALKPATRAPFLNYLGKTLPW